MLTQPYGQSATRDFPPDMTTTYHTIIVSGVRLYCEGLAQRLAGHPILRVVGTATDLLATQECVRDLRPDVVLLDVSSRGVKRL